MYEIAGARADPRGCGALHFAADINAIDFCRQVSRRISNAKATPVDLSAIEVAIAKVGPNAFASVFDIGHLSAPQTVWPMTLIGRKARRRDG